MTTGSVITVVRHLYAIVARNVKRTTTIVAKGGIKDNGLSGTCQRDAAVVVLAILFDLKADLVLVVVKPFIIGTCGLSTRARSVTVRLLSTVDFVVMFRTLRSILAGNVLQNNKSAQFYVVVSTAFL